MSEGTETAFTPSAEAKMKVEQRVRQASADPQTPPTSPMYRKVGEGQDSATRAMGDYKDLGSNLHKQKERVGGERVVSGSSGIASVLPRETNSPRQDQAGIVGSAVNVAYEGVQEGKGDSMEANRREKTRQESRDRVAGHTDGGKVSNSL